MDAYTRVKKERTDSEIQENEVGQPSLVMLGCGCLCAAAGDKLFLSCHTIANHQYQHSIRSGYCIQLTFMLGLGSSTR